MSIVEITKLQARENKLIGIKSSDKQQELVSKLESRLDTNTKGVTWADVVRKPPQTYLPTKTTSNSIDKQQQ